MREGNRTTLDQLQSFTSFLCSHCSHHNLDFFTGCYGYRHAVGRQAAQAATLDLKSSAFDPREKVWTKFPPVGSKYTPPHQSCDFRWKDYCPLVFRQPMRYFCLLLNISSVCSQSFSNIYSGLICPLCLNRMYRTLRRLFKVDAADYMLSICGNDALRELSSPGKSGSFFYLTNDDGYMIKTIKKAEVKVRPFSCLFHAFSVDQEHLCNFLIQFDEPIFIIQVLLRMLPAYFKHVRSYEILWWQSFLACTVSN